MTAIGMARFWRQYHATGRDKADGYCAADFAGMSASEHAQACSLLLERALAGDTIDMAGLRFAGDQATVVALVEAEPLARRLGWRWDIARHELLFDLTGAPEHLLALAPYLDGRADEALAAAANAIGQRLLPPNAELFLTVRICDGRHEAALLALLSALVALRQGSPCDSTCFQRHLPFIRAVSAAPPRHRAALLADREKKD